MGTVFLKALCVARVPIVTALLSLALSGCNSLSSLLFYPHQVYYQTPDDLNVNYQRVVLDTEDGEKLANWILFPKKDTTVKGTVFHLHGNGENISTHMNAVAWLTLHGYQVFLLDYRGYGESTGASTLDSALSDIHTAHHWISEHSAKPVFLFGQSMGGALAIAYTGKLSQIDEFDLQPFNALISESAPASWPQIAREAMSQHWLTWPVVPATVLIPGKWDAEDHLEYIGDIPLLLMHSRKDHVVGFQHYEQLVDVAEENELNLKTYETNGKHTQGLAYEGTRKLLLEFLDEHSRKAN